VEQLGGRPTPGIGFAMGVDRLLLLAEAVGSVPEALAREVDAYLLPLDDDGAPRALALARELRAAVPGLRLQLHCGGGKTKARFRRADASGAELALILGEEELAAGTVGVKPLRGEGEQRTLAVDALIEELRARFGAARG
jgi:histidyl-tRNA synthetase